MQVSKSVYALRARIKPYAEAYSPNVYLVTHGDRAIMIDSGFAGPSAQARLEYLRTIGSPRVEAILLTHHHIDHCSGAPGLAEVTGARIGMHPEEKRLLDLSLAQPRPPRSDDEGALQQETARLRVDFEVNDGDTFSLGPLTLRAVLTPGHSAGHLAFLLEEERVLFGGDNVLGFGTTAIAPPPFGDMAAYLQSLETMLALDAAVICTGHGPLVRRPARKIREIIAHRHERDRQVLALLGEGKRSLSELVVAVYPELDPRLEHMAHGQILSHLYKLQSEGKLTLRIHGDDIDCVLS